MVEAKDSNYCETKEDIMIFVDTCTVTSNNNLFLNQISIFPNPTKGGITINLPRENSFSLSLYEINGKLINRWEKIFRKLIIDSNKISSGFYIVRIENDYLSEVFKIIKK